MVEDAAAPAGESAPAEGTGEAAVAAGDGVASVGVGNAPGTDGDALAAGEGAEGVAAAAPATPAAVAKFLFNNREFRDQAHAENVYGTLDTEKRGLQRQNAERGTRVTSLEAELAALRGMIPQNKGNGKGPGEATDGAPQSLAEKLAKSGDLTYYAGLAVNKDGQITQEGLAKAMFALTEDLDKNSAESLKTAVEKIQGEGSAREQRQASETSIARAFTAVGNLIEEFPELDENTTNPDALLAQDAVLERLRNTPQVPAGPNGQLEPMGFVWLSQKPQEALRWAITEHRREFGIPVVAKTPGSSESTSAKAAAAAEKQAANAAAAPLDGSGVPRQGRSPADQSMENRWRRESAASRKAAKTPSGRSLGFEESA